MTYNKTGHELLFIVFILISFFSSVSSNLKAQSPVIESVKLSKDKAFSWCPLPCEIPNAECGRQQTRIKVRTSAKNTDDEIIGYVYVVSGGEIEGRGPNVVWDLSKAQPGKHSITVGLGYGLVVKGKTITKTIIVEACPECHLPCECSLVNLRGPDKPINAGDALIVEADLVGGPDLTYKEIKWTVSDGAIIESQGTFRVLVRIKADTKAKIIKVTYSIPAVCLGGCPDAAKEFGIITNNP